jgi:hypothetical protein
MTVADKLRIKQRRTPRAAKGGGRRMRRAHDPSGLGRRRLRLRRHPQHQTGRARGLRRQRQLAAGDEVELSRLAPEFQHDDADRIAGQRVGSRPQRDVHIGRPHRHEQTRIETEFTQPAHRHRARFNLGEILPYPHQRPMGKFRGGGPAREPGDKTGRRRTLPAGLRKHFVHRPQGEAALQRRVDLRMSERHPARRIRLAMRLDALDIAAQTRKRVRARAGHVRRSLRRLGPPVGSVGRTRGRPICS